MVSDMQLGLVTVDNETIVDHETICGLFVRLFVPLGSGPCETTNQTTSFPNGFGCKVRPTDWRTLITIK